MKVTEKNIYGAKIMAKKTVKEDTQEIVKAIKAKQESSAKAVAKKAAAAKAKSELMESEFSKAVAATKTTTKSASTKIQNKDEASAVKSGNINSSVNASNENTNVRYSDEDLEVFAEVINEAKVEALDELRMLKERLEDLTSFDAGEESMIYSMHMAEQGSEAQEKEKTYAQIQRISEHIKKLEDAMERIRNKSYGICRVCGCLIAKERLMAVPVTTLSAAYKIHSKCPEDGIDKIEPVKL
jgi:RNA polymerase-binding transcription factor DksA